MFDVHLGEHARSIFNLQFDRYLDFAISVGIGTSVFRESTNKSISHCNKDLNLIWFTKMSDKSEIFDSILLGLAEKHTGGVPDVSKIPPLFLFHFSTKCTKDGYNSPSRNFRYKFPFILCVICAVVEDNRRVFGPEDWFFHRCWRGRMEKGKFSLRIYSWIMLRLESTKPGVFNVTHVSDVVEHFWGSR